MTAELEDDAKNMGVLALNAAIEAARMGENGEKFLHAAEEIKNVAQRYEERLKALSEQIDAMEEAQKEIKEQTAQINEMQAGITSMVMKLYSDSAQKLPYMKWTDFFKGAHVRQRSTGCGFYKTGRGGFLKTRG